MPSQYDFLLIRQLAERERGLFSIVGGLKILIPNVSEGEGLRKCKKM